MDFRKFFDKSKFTLFARGDSNWDLYVMRTDGTCPSLVALAKSETGATDCCFGGIDYLNYLDQRGYKHGYVRV